MNPLADMQIAFVGGGTMAEAFIRGLLAKDLVPAEALAASDPLEARRSYLSREVGITTKASNAEAVAGADIIVLAVKPQVLDKVLSGLEGQVAEETLVLSIVAGAPIALICQALDIASAVRVMPNTPGQIGEGISVWMATPETSETQREQARAILSALGKEIRVENEDYLDMATALSGSGPAYVFLFMEALIDAGVQMGFSHAIARELALQTVRGAAIYAQETGEHMAVLRNRVTSPGGTTAEALYRFEKGGLRAVVSEAVLAAYQKARELGES
ncbi:MAG: pyrroline-5-carboxylate reductase [Chloroflexota bacterium]|nr:pyrroline-5-carboxylate reductase [Chloroflexota bacterium]